MGEIVKAAAKKPEAKRENKVSQTKKTDPPQSISSPVEQILFLQRTIGNQAVGRLIKTGALQAKLRIGQPGDIYEQEADRVAEQIMRMPEPVVSKETGVSNPALNNSIQRKCPGCNKGTKIEKKVKEKLQKKEASGSTHEVTPELESSISAVRGGGQPLPDPVREFFEPRFGHDFSKVRVHTDAKAAEAARGVNARAFMVGQDVVFGAGEYIPQMHNGQWLLAHELTHVVQQGSMNFSSASSTIQRRISPEDASSEMIGLRFQVTGPFTSGQIVLSGNEIVEVIAWSNTSTSARVQLPAPYLNAYTPFDIPKALLLPAAPAVSGMAPYSSGVTQAVRSIERGEQAITAERTRRGGPRPGEIARLEGLQRNRERLLNRRLIQQAMFNRFDPVIRQWTDYYNNQFGYSGARALDPNLVKSMLFQESQMGTSGQHLEEPPSHPVKTRFNLGQVIDSSAAALLIMMEEMQPALITTYHLGNIRTDLSRAQQELQTLSRLRTRNPTQQARLAELTRLSSQSWEVFMWNYRASGQSTGFNEAVVEFFASTGTGLLSRNMDYEFWIRTAIRWLFEKRRTVRNWEDAIRAYNGSGDRARHYRDAVTRRARASGAAQRAGREYIPENI